jgi:hypothetical protein
MHRLAQRGAQHRVDETGLHIKQRLFFISRIRLAISMTEFAAA